MLKDSKTRAYLKDRFGLIFGNLITSLKLKNRQDLQKMIY